MTARVRLVEVIADDRFCDRKGVPVGVRGEWVSLIVEVSDRDFLSGGDFEIGHPAFDQGRLRCHFQGLHGTGAPRLPRRKAPSVDHVRANLFCYRAKLVNDQSAAAAITLSGAVGCTLDPPGPGLMLQCVTDASKLICNQVRYLQARSSVLQVSKAANAGAVAQVGNTTKAPVSFFAQFFFTGADGKGEIPFPAGVVIEASLGVGGAMPYRVPLEPGGALALVGLSATEVEASPELKLSFIPGKGKFIVEGAGRESPVLGDEPTRNQFDLYDVRCFALPERWALIECDLTVTDDDARWDAGTSMFKMVSNGSAASLGSDAKPVRVVVDLHWQHLRFEYFDRYYGHSHHGDKPVTPPPLVIDGYHAIPAPSSTQPAATVPAADTRSSWWVERDGFVQAVPWILQKDSQGAPTPRPTQKELLELTLKPGTYARSISETRRELVCPSTPLAPGPERLRDYDLPARWRSTSYFVRVDADAGHYGYLQQDPKTTVDKPLRFSLDDIVLTTRALEEDAGWTNNLSFAIHSHTFATRTDVSEEGVYKPYMPDAPWFTTPLSSTDPSSGYNYLLAPEKTWARVVAANGHLYEVFDKRTIARSTSPGDVVGARAAVCWAASTPPNPGTPLPARVDEDYLSIQTFFTQAYVERFNKYDPAKSGNIGRFDIALLRCCDVELDASGRPREVAVNLHFHKLWFDANLVSPASGSLQSFQVSYCRTILDRFNGADKINGGGRAELLPTKPTVPLRVVVVHHLAVVDQAQAHFTIKLVDHTLNGRDWRNIDGTGETNNADPAPGAAGFINAHEHGHQSGLPDEYNERWSAHSYGQPSFAQTLPGDPFEIDGRREELAEPGKAPLMNGLFTMHNRYFWHAAEWSRAPLKHELKVKLGRYDDYRLPAHADDDRTYAYWPLNGPLNDQFLPPRGKANLFLYALGKEAFSVEALPNLAWSYWGALTGGGPFDGILVVTILLKVVTQWWKEDDAKKLVRSIALASTNAVPKNLNYTWCLSGKHRGAAAWEFKRCLIHLSPRVLVAPATDPPESATYVAMSAFGADPVAKEFADRLDKYHAGKQTPTSRQQLFGELIKFDVIPAGTLEGAWDSDSGKSRSDPQRPSEFNAIDTAITQYQSAAVDPTAQAHAAAAVASSTDNWYSTNGQAHTYSSAVTALWARASAVAEVRRQQAQLEAWRQQLDANWLPSTPLWPETEHGFHFEIQCEPGKTNVAQWISSVPAPDLPDVRAWSVPESERRDASVSVARSALATYQKTLKLDIESRISQLSTIASIQAPSNAVQSIQAQATALKASLEAAKTSRTLHVTTTSPPDFSQAILDALPTMIGINKPAAQITAADFMPLIKLLPLDNAQVKKV